VGKYCPSSTLLVVNPLQAPNVPQAPLQGPLAAMQSLWRKYMGPKVQGPWIKATEKKKKKAQQPQLESVTKEILDLNGQREYW